MGRVECRIFGLSEYQKTVIRGRLFTTKPFAIFYQISFFLAHLVKYRRVKRNIDEELRLFRGCPRQTTSDYTLFVCGNLEFASPRRFSTKKMLAEPVEAKLSTFTLIF